MFQELKFFKGGDFCNNIEQLNEVEKIFEDYNISKLDIKRIYRYLDKNIKKEVIIYGDDDIADDE